MSSADLWEDGYPHGTVEGFDNGCRGGACPADAEIGMSCKRAKALAAGDFRYNRLVAAGKTPAEIAATIDGRDIPADAETAPVKPRAPKKPKPAPAPQEAAPAAQEDDAVDQPVPVDEPATVAPGGVYTDIPFITEPDQPEKYVPLTHPEENAVPTTPLTTEKFTAGLTQAARTFVLRSIREWARANGYPGVPTHGRIPQDALAAFDAAHPNGIVGTNMAAAAPAGMAEHVAQLRAIRSWARENGWPEIEDRGPVDDEIRAAYDAAHQDGEFTHPGAPSAEDTEPAGVDTAAPEADADEPEVDTASAPRDFTADIGDVRDRAGLSMQPMDPAALDRALEEAQRYPLTTAHPEWSEVAISEDVERARQLAIRLEGENALLLEQVSAAHRALEFVLRINALQSTDIDDLRSALEVTKGSLAWAELQVGIANSSNTLLHARVGQLQDELDAARLAKPWWKRTA